MSLIFAFFLCFASPIALADVNFFGSVRAAKSTVSHDNAEFDGVSNSVNVSRLSTAGVSFHTSLQDKYQALTQFILKDNGSIGVDLLQVRYQVTDDFLVRVGKQRLPFHMYSEHIQVQALLPWMTAPREVYAKVPVYSFTGASVEKRLGDYVSVHAFGGDQRDNFYQEDLVYKTQTSDLLGGRLNVNWRQHSFFAMGFQANTKLEIETQVPIPSTQLSGKYEPSFVLNSLKGFNSGYRYQNLDFFFLTEYSLIMSRDSSFNRMDAMYASIGKDFGEQWTSVLTFSTDLHVDSHISPSKTATYAYNLNYRLDMSNVIKFGIEHVNFKERTVPSPTLAGTSNGTVLSNMSPGENFEIYSLMWAFVY